MPHGGKFFSSWHRKAVLVCYQRRRALTREKTDRYGVSFAKTHFDTPSATATVRIIQNVGLVLGLELSRLARNCPKPRQWRARGPGRCALQVCVKSQRVV